MMLEGWRVWRGDSGEEGEKSRQERDSVDFFIIERGAHNFINN